MPTKEALEEEENGRLIGLAEEQKVPRRSSSRRRDSDSNCSWHVVGKSEILFLRPEPRNCDE